MNKSLFDTNLKSIENFILNSAPDISYSNFLYAILISAVLASIVKFVYVRISRTLNDREHFSEIFVPLAIITTLVITVIKFSLALSLGLVGALSIVRFRAAIKEPEELVYLFFIIAIGLANGANQFLVSIISTFFIISVLLIKKYFDDMGNLFPEGQPEWKNQIQISFWFYEHEMYQQALTSIVEGIKSYAMIEIGLDWKDREKRDSFPKEQFKGGRNKRQILGDDLAKLYIKANKWRNEVNHGGLLFKEASSMTKSVMDEIDRVFQSPFLDNLLKK